MSEHTKTLQLPLRCYEDHNLEWRIRDAAGLLLCSDLDEGEAEHIVRCVNQHDKLVAALRIADESLCRATFPGPRNQSDLNYAIQRVRAALADAGGE